MPLTPPTPPRAARPRRRFLLPLGGALLLALPLAARADADGASPARPRATSPVFGGLGGLFGSDAPATAAPVSAPAFYRLDAGYWNFEPRGNAVFSGSAVDFQRDLNLRASNRAVYRAEVSENLADTAHPWYLPVQGSVDYLASTFTGQQTILPTTLLAIGPIQIVQNGTTVNTDTRFRDAGGELGWRLWQFLPGARLEGGVALKNVQADIAVVSPGQTQAARQTANATFPLPSLAVVAGRGQLRLRAEAQYGRIGGRDALNAEALLNYQPSFLRYLGLEAGWRFRRYRFDSDNTSGDRFDLRLSGFRVGGRVEFGPAP